MLIVDDNPTFRQLLKGILRTRFPLMVIEEAADGQEALQKVDVLRPEIIFVGMKLPDETGFELTKKIKTDYPKPIIIMLLSYDLLEYRQAAFQCGADYVLSKDLSSRNEILELVESILSNLDLNFDDPKRGGPS